jgi:hypothetical protein
MTVDKILGEVIANKYCKGCVLSECQDLVEIRDRSIEFRMKYIPSRINTLLVGESPPMRLDERYFYAPKEVQKGTLFCHTMDVLFEKEMKEIKTRGKEYFLNRFRDQGFYLTDMTKCPINNLSKDEKAKPLESCSQYLKMELDAFGFKSIRTIFIGKGSFKIVRRKLDLTFDPVVIPLPFGSQRNVENYKIELKRNLRK